MVEQTLQRDTPRRLVGRSWRRRPASAGVAREPALSRQPELSEPEHGQPTQSTTEPFQPQQLQAEQLQAQQFQSEHPQQADMSNARHPWMPLSPCGSECLPTPGSVPTVAVARRVSRFLVAVGVLLAGIGLALCLPLLPGVLRRRALSGWFAALLRAFGITLQVTGDREFTDVRGGALFVSNHVSWLDVVALNAVRPVRFLAKREIRTWPIVGQLAHSAGTVFVNRERLSELPKTVDRLAEVLRAGGQINVFPEGTTWCGQANGRWRPAAFQAAIDAAVPVVPVALRYRQPHGPSTAVAFVGEMTLWDTLCRTLALRGLVIEVDIAAVLSSDSVRTRRELAAAAERAVTGRKAPVATDVLLPRRTSSAA